MIPVMDVVAAAADVQALALVIVLPAAAVVVVAVQDARVVVVAVAVVVVVATAAAAVVAVVAVAVVLHRVATIAVVAVPRLAIRAVPIPARLLVQQTAILLVQHNVLVRQHQSKRGNDMREYVIEVNSEVTEYMERLSYEIACRSDIISMLIEKHRDDASILESEAFKAYSEQLSAVWAENELAKRELQETVIPKEFRNHIYEWSLDFRTSELTIKLLCACEVTYGKKV